MYSRIKFLLAISLLFFWVGIINSEAAIVGEWGFNDSDNPVKDTSGNGNDGLLDGGAEWIAEGHIGGAISFDGVDAFAEIPDAEILAPLEAATVCIWVYPRSYNLEWLGIFGKGGNHMDFDLLINMNDKLAHFYVSGVVNNYNVASKETVPLNDWTHLAVSYKSEGEIQIFINGESSGEADMGEQRNPSNEPILLGKSFWPNRWFDGNLDEVYLLDEALDEAGIQEIMMRDVSPVKPESKLASAWGNIKSW